jgi:hypothetical protein
MKALAVALLAGVTLAQSSALQVVTERSNPATEERFKTGQAAGVVSIAPGA